MSNVFGKSVTPKRQSETFEDRVSELIVAGLTQDQALEQASDEMPAAW